MSFNVVQSAEQLPLVTPCRFSIRPLSPLLLSKLSSLEPGSLSAPSKYIRRGRCRCRGLSSRPISHIILQYSVLQFLPARFLLVLRFFFCRNAATDDDRHVYVCVFAFRFFYHARSRDNPCPDVSVIYIFFSGSCADRVSLKNPCTDPIGDSRSLVRTLPRDRVFFFFSKCLRGSVPAYPRDISQRYSYKRLDSELLISSSFSASVCPEPFATRAA